MVPVLWRRQLDRHQTGFALGEALAHLHYLVGQGEIERTAGRERRQPLPAQGGVRRVAARRNRAAQCAAGFAVPSWADATGSGCAISPCGNGTSSR